MAAVRAGAVGLSKGSRYFVYSSTPPVRDWQERSDGNPSSPLGEPFNSTEGSPVKRKGYGIAVSSPEIDRVRWSMRRQMIDLKLRLCDWTLFLALFGLALAVLDVEITAAKIGQTFDSRFYMLSYFLRIIIIVSTLVLVVVLLAYHIVDAKVYLMEAGSDSWRVGITSQRLFLVAVELGICSICPIPETGTVSWPLLGQSVLFTRRRYEMPVNVLICLPMFARMYLLARYIVMHSSQYQSALYHRPLTVLSATTAVFWIVMAWMITQCERFAFESIPGYQHFLDFLWFVIITFFSIGYGDVQVHSFCGRAMALVTAVLGTLFASILIALVARRMALSSSEKRVNHLIAESQLTIQHKNAAARVLQATWRTVLRRRESEVSHARHAFYLTCSGDSTAAPIRFRLAQRKLLSAILTFRRSRWRLRRQLEEDDDFFAARKAFLETEERLSRVRKRQAQLNVQMNTLYEHVQTLTSIIQ